MTDATVTIKVSIKESSLLLRALEEYKQTWEEKGLAIPDTTNPDRNSYLRWAGEAIELLHKLRG